VFTDHKRIAIPLSTNVVPKGNLRLILRQDKVEVHYAVEVVNSPYIKF
jgi:hypothetical protein